MFHHMYPERGSLFHHDNCRALMKNSNTRECVINLYKIETIFFEILLKCRHLKILRHECTHLWHFHSYNSRKIGFIQFLRYKTRGYGYNTAYEMSRMKKKTVVLWSTVAHRLFAIISQNCSNQEVHHDHSIRFEDTF